MIRINIEVQIRDHVKTHQKLMFVPLSWYLDEQFLILYNVCYIHAYLINPSSLYTDVLQIYTS